MSSALTTHRKVGDILRTTPLFGRITGVADLAQLCGVAHLRTARRFDVIVEQGLPVTDISVIVTGKVTVSFSGGTVKSLELGEGSLFGEMEFFERTVSLGTVTAEENLELLCLPFKDLLQIVTDNPITGMQLYHGFLLTLVEKHRLVTDSLVQWKLDRSLQHVAHDLRSPIAALRLVQKMTRDSSGSGAELLDGAIERLENLAVSLRVGEKDAEEKKLKVHAVVDAVMRVVEEKQAHLPDESPIKLSFDLDDLARDEGNVRCEVVLVERIVSNFLDNSIEAMPQGRGDIAVKMTVSAAACVIEIEDTGCGFDASVMQKVGQYPVSTKDESTSSNRGLGLFYAFRTVRRWGGTLYICSAAQWATKIRLTLLVDNPLYSFAHFEDRPLLPKHVVSKWAPI